MGTIGSAEKFVEAYSFINAKFCRSVMILP